LRNQTEDNAMKAAVLLIAFVSILVPFTAVLHTDDLLAAEPTATTGGAAPEQSMKAISFKPDSTTSLDFEGTALLPNATGHAKVTKKTGVAQIEARFEGLEAARLFGPEYLTYVLWAVTPEGRPNNLGPIELKGNRGEIRTTTRLQTFALGVTAEPYFAVTMPSDTVVLRYVVPDKMNIQAEKIDVKAELMQRGAYRAADLPTAPIDAAVPGELLQARNAVAIARSQQADRYAADAFEKAATALAAAEATQKDKRGKRQAVIMSAREAVQASEDARVIAVKRAAEERSAQEQAAAAQRTAQAQAQAGEAEQRTAQAQQQAQDAQQQMAQSDAARTAAITQQQRAQDAAAAARESSRQLRAQLFQQLNKVLATQDTDRGLVITMADVTFDTGKANLRPAAREKLAKLSGILALHPGLKLDIEGHTDSVGSEATNQALSEKRAVAVRDYLVQEGLSAESIATKGLGKAAPIAPNENPAGRAKNRRVELVLTGEAIGAKVGG
jgi:outer membrane protein OmpA-like peptidoglycan-associated protein